MKTLKKIGAIALVGLVGLGGCVSDSQNQQDIKDAASDAREVAMAEACGDMDIVGGKCVPTADDVVTEVKEMTEKISFVMGSTDEDIEYGEVMDFIYDIDDITTLSKGEVNVNGDEYKFTERIEGNFKVSTGVDDKKYADTIRLPADKEIIKNYLYYHKAIPLSEIDSDELIVNLANKKILVKSIGATSMTYQDATETTLTEGVTKVIEGVNVTLLGVDRIGTAKITDGIRIVLIPRGEEEKLGDLQVRNMVAFEGDKGMASVIIGKDITKTVSIYEEFEDYADGKKIPYVYSWTLANNNTELKQFGYKSNINWDDTTDKYDAEAIKVGASYNLPNEYGQINLVSGDNAKLKNNNVNIEDGKVYVMGPFEIDGEDYSTLEIDYLGNVYAPSGEILDTVNGIELLDSELDLVITADGINLVLLSFENDENNIVISTDIDVSVPGAEAITAISKITTDDLKEGTSFTVCDVTLTDDKCVNYDIKNHRGDVITEVDELSDNEVELMIRDKDKEPEAKVTVSINKKEVELIEKTVELDVTTDDTTGA